MSSQLRIFRDPVRRQWLAVLPAMSALAIAGGLRLAAGGVPPGQHIWFVNDDGDPRNDCTSWPDACPDLQTALSLATAGDQIWVAEGTYRPSVIGGARGTTFQLINGVALYGGFDGSETTLEERAGLFDQTLLTGDRAGNDVPVPCEQDAPDCDSFGGRCVDGSCILEQNNDENSYHVTTGSGTDASAILDGFTIKAGNANAPFSFDRGGGMFNSDGSPTVVNCTFSGNTAVAGGGGMLNRALSPCTDSQDPIGPSNPTLIACTFIGNAASAGGAIANSDGSSPSIKNCVFAHNAAVSPLGTGGVGGAVKNTRCCTPILDSCSFIENSTKGWGGGIYSFFQSDAVVINCTFTGNTATFYGGGMYNLGSNPTVTNCTFSGNDADIGRALVLESIGEQNPSELSMTNCILWDGGDEVWRDDHSTINIAYSNVQGGWPGVGNINADPLFVDADGPDGIPGTQDDNLRLSPGSPAIDAADNTAVPEGVVTDLDGNPRFVDDPDTPDTGNPDGINPIVDMGAYEFGPPDLCADEDSDGQMTICHIPPGNPDNAHTITVGVNAVPAHLAHGDYCGPCGEDGGLLNVGNSAPTANLCPTDLSSDGIVGAEDLAQLLGSWGPCAGCPTDFNGDGVVGAFDLAQLLGAWGPCE